MPSGTGGHFFARYFSDSIAFQEDDTLNQIPNHILFSWKIMT